MRATLTAWLKVYGEANNLPGLATGPIEARFHRLRENASADEMVIWTTPERRAAGAGPQVRIPALQFDLACRFADGHIVAEALSQMSADAREPQRERGSVGVVMTVGRIELPPEGDQPDPLAVEIEAIFDRLTENRWRGFVTPLREALEAEARDDVERAERLATPYQKAEPRQGGRGQESPFRLSGLTVSGAAGFDDGEWLDLMNERGVAIATARLIHVDVGAGTMDVDARGADPPMPGIVRPRPRVRIIDQKRAILDELESPRGNLPLVARLMASPAAMPIPRPTYPTQFLNQNVGRSRTQARAVALALGLAEGEALLIEGPPGTGKSTTTGEIVAQVITRDPQARILVCSHSNHGTDNMLMKIVPYLEKCPGLMPARVGMFDRVSPELRRYYVTPDENLADRNVIFTTIDALALNDAAGGTVYDYVVLDEANRATVLDSLIALTRGKRFIMVGDRLQLQPVLSEAEEQLRLEPALARAGVIGKSLFVWLTERHFPDRAVVFLDEQNRMHPVIGGLIARAFYEDRLRNGPAAPRRETGVPHFPQPAVWVDTRGLRGLKESRGRGPSLFNLPEARLVTTIARHLLRSAPEGMELGVIAAYAEQAALLRRLLRNDGRTTPGRKLEIDTVDAFEGREKDIIVVSLVRSNKRREIGFLQLMQRINVALSRARRLLIVVGDTATLRGSYFDRILRYMRERQSIVPGPRVIAQLRGGEVRPMMNPRERNRPMPAQEGRVGEAPGGRGFRRFPHGGRIGPNHAPQIGPNPIPAQIPSELVIPAPTGDSMPPEIPDFEPSVSLAPPPVGIGPPSNATPVDVGDQSTQDVAISSVDRRPIRNRRSPAEILARLNGAIQPSGESGHSESAERSMSDASSEDHAWESFGSHASSRSGPAAGPISDASHQPVSDSQPVTPPVEESATQSANTPPTDQAGTPVANQEDAYQPRSGSGDVAALDVPVVQEAISLGVVAKRKPRPSRARAATTKNASLPLDSITTNDVAVDAHRPETAPDVNSLSSHSDRTLADNGAISAPSDERASPDAMERIPKSAQIAREVLPDAIPADVRDARSESDAFLPTPSPDVRRPPARPNRSPSGQFISAKSLPAAPVAPEAGPEIGKSAGSATQKRPRSQADSHARANVAAAGRALMAAATAIASNSRTVVEGTTTGSSMGNSDRVPETAISESSQTQSEGPSGRDLVTMPPVEFAGHVALPKVASGLEMSNDDVHTVPEQLSPRMTDGAFPPDAPPIPARPSRRRSSTKAVQPKQAELPLNVPPIIGDEPPQT